MKKISALLKAIVGLRVPDLFLFFTLTLLLAFISYPTGNDEAKEASNVKGPKRTLDVGAKVADGDSRIQVGEEVYEIYETAHPYEGTGIVWEKTFHWPNASYIRIHFAEFDLAPGDYVEISGPDGNYKYRYVGKGKVVRRGQAFLGAFWASHIPGDTAIVRLYSTDQQSGYGFIIDKWAHGYEPEIIRDLFRMEQGGIEAICGADDKEWAPCYDGTTIYEKSRTVARLLIGGTSACTGWLLGSEGHVMTNSHCIGSQSDADNTDYEFRAEGETCWTDCSDWFACPGIVEAASGTLIQSNRSLDYSLILLPRNLTPKYGYLQMRDDLPIVGERIYIPQHPQAWGKQIGVLCDQTGEFCEIYSTDEPPCLGGPGDIGYFCDTAGGSSGSPVLGYSDHCVVALHHCANCPNRGVPIPSIISNLGKDLPADAICGGGPVWETAYNTLFDSPSDLELLRQYRDEVLSKTASGKNYKDLLYQSSEEALEVLRENPELIAHAKILIDANRDAVSDVLGGHEGIIYNTEEIVSFLNAYASEAPLALKALVKVVKTDMLRKQIQNELFFGFRLE